MTVESKCIKDIIKAASGSPDDMVRVLQANYEALDKKAAKKNGVSVLSIVSASFDAIDDGSDLVQDLYKGAQIIAKKMDDDADGTAKNPYHNRLHAVKVVMNVFVLAMMQNASGKYGSKISVARLAELFVAAPTHDIFNDGRGNGRGADHVPYKLEQRSIDMAVRWLREAGPEKLEERVIRRCQNAFELIYATDVSTAGVDDKQLSPAHIMRALYDQPRHQRPDLSGLHPNLWGIASDPDRIEQAALLSDADTMASVLTPERSFAENQRVADELGVVVTPEFTAFFFDNVIQGRTNTRVANALYGQNIKVITAMVRNGIVPGMPLPEPVVAEPTKPKKSAKSVKPKALEA